jgi:hypothetical protein
MAIFRSNLLHSLTIFGRSEGADSARGGGSTTKIPPAIIVAVFAYLGTRVVARYGFARKPQGD